MTPIGTTRTGEPIHQVTLTNGQLTVSLLTLGVALQDVRLTGIPHSLTVGSPDPSAYETDMEYCGTIVGPVANRISGAQATIDGQIHRFDANLDGKHTLHGGSASTHNKLWTLADPAIASAGNLHYLAGWPDPDTFRVLLADLCTTASIATTDLPDGLRQRDTATHRFLFNYAPEAITFNGTEIPPAGVHWTPL